MYTRIYINPSQRSLVPVHTMPTIPTMPTTHSIINNLNFKSSNASQYNFKKCNLAIIHYVLQFMTDEEKKVLIKKIYKQLIKSGAMIVFEKTLIVVFLY